MSQPLSISLDYSVMHYYLLYALRLHIKVILSYVACNQINKAYTDCCPYIMTNTDDKIISKSTSHLKFKVK